MYEYYWGHTAAQVELMLIDAPFVAYKKREKTMEEKMKNYTREKAERDYNRWMERKKKRKTSLKSFLGDGNVKNGKPITGE